MQIFPTRMCNVKSMTSLETAPPLANGPSGGGLRGNSMENCSVFYHSLAMVALEESVGGD